ncbi:hypothetical protein [Geoglobus acetivorans]|uniref:GTPase-activating protein n=1 Tax=Geoglobus acetivorans TaxID=565033 RepID=A0ABZ3H2I2_GEOAI|nr:hypothetical protein [Geoglobus acetivorans]
MYAAYYCTENCDGKPCIVVYPEDVPPTPKSCLIGSSNAEWEHLTGLKSLDKFVDEALDRIDELMSDEEV